MSEAENQAAKGYENWKAPISAEEPNETNLASELVHRYFYQNETDLLDNISPEDRMDIIFSMAGEYSGIAVILDCCLKYIKDPEEQTRLSYLLHDKGGLSSAIRLKELENVQPEVIAALLIHAGDAMSAYEFFAYKAIDSTVVRKIIEEELGGDAIVVDSSLQLLRAAGNFYDKKNQTPDYEKFEKKIKDFLVACNLDPSKTLSVWRDNAAFFDPFDDKEPQQQKLARTHIDTLMALESMNSGNARFLLEKYGIENFGRYGSKILLNQIEQSKDVDSKYGIAVFPKHDYNAAFGIGKHGELHYQHMLSYIQDELKNLESNLRIYEVSTKTELYHKVMQAKKSYERTAGKIQFALLAGHGSWGGLQLGNNWGGSEQNSEITYGDLLKLGDTSSAQELPNIAFSRFKDCFVENADLILHSCSTGSGEDNIAKLGSKVSNFRITAPTEDAGASNLFVSEKDGRVHLASYYSASKKIYHRGEESEKNEYAA